MADATILYGIPNCSTIKKARDWLAAHQVPYAFHDFKKSGVSVDLIAAWLVDIELDTLLNRKGTTWRGLPEARKAAVIDQRSATELMIELPSLIKRPVLVLAASGAGNRSGNNGRIYVGFSDVIYQQIFQT